MNIGTILFTLFNGELVGADEFGTQYYQSKWENRWGRKQRWCLYKGSKEATRVPAEWHAWLHYTVPEPLTSLAVDVPSWLMPHKENLTGTIEAYRPRGHMVKGGKRPQATGDYEAWEPADN